MLTLGFEFCSGKVDADHVAIKYLITIYLGHAIKVENRTKGAVVKDV